MQIYPCNKKVLSSNVNPHCCGIDLGTTYTLMAVVDSSYINFSSSSRVPVQFVRVKQTSPNPYDSAIEDEKIASMVAVIDGKPYIGNNLYHLKGADSYEFRKNLFYHWKIEMGVDHYPMYPHAVSEKLDMPYKLSGIILKYLRATYLKDAHKQLDNAIITVPASFQANQRVDTIRAAQMGGVVTSEHMLIDEPNAAFIGYFNRLPEKQKQEWAKNVRNKDILVIDFGGGTLDLSILNVDFHPKRGIVISNKAISRYNDLGGQDLDHVIAEEILYPMLTKKFPPLKELTQSELQDHILPQLAVLAEKIKKDICEKISLKALNNDARTLNLAEIRFELDGCQLNYNATVYSLGDIVITGEQFDQIFKKLFVGKNYRFNLIDKCITTISESITNLIDKSNIRMNNIDYVLYVGGSSFNPLLQSYVAEKLRSSQPLTTHEPDKLVAEGAAVYSYFYYKQGMSLISPITSDAIGIRTKGNHFKEIIAAGTQLPAKISLPEFRLQSSMQDEIVVPVCINSTDYPIGEIRCKLNSIFPSDTQVVIDASLTANKVFDLRVIVDGEEVGAAEFDNPYSIGMVSSEQLALSKLTAEINQAKQKRNKLQEKTLLRELIWKHSEVNNNRGVIQAAEQYIECFDDQDSSIWNLLFCHHYRLGQTKAAKRALEKALELEPEEASYIYNYSLLLERDSDEVAFNYLVKQPDSVQQDETIAIKIVLLSSAIGKPWKDQAEQLTKQYLRQPKSFSDFDKRVLLPELFKLAGKPYSYVTPKIQKDSGDEKSYLATNSFISGVE